LTSGYGAALKFAEKCASATSRAKALTGKEDLIAAQEALCHPRALFSELFSRALSKR
jgi:hypothetical protein